MAVKSNNNRTTRVISTIAFLVCNVCAAQYTVFELDVASNKLLYNVHDNRIYASVPSANGSNGNSIGIVDPQTVELDTTIFVGSEPGEIALSDNGEFLYIGFTSSPVVKQFDLTTQTVTQEVLLGTHHTGDEPLFAEDIEVMPGNSNTIAVARRRYGVSPRHGGVRIIENGIPLPNEVVGHTGSNRIEFKSSEEIIGFNNESTGFHFHELAITVQGADLQNSYPYVLTGFNVDILFGDNRLYSTNGRAFNLEPTPYQVGIFDGVNGPVHYNQSESHVCYVTSSSFGIDAHFTVFDAQTFLLVEDFTVYDTDDYVLSIIGCGTGCYAFNTSEKIYILKSIDTGVTSTLSKSEIGVHPNPSSGLIYIQSADDIQSAELVDLRGQSIVAGVKEDYMDLTGLSKGLYILKVLDAYGNYSTHRVVKE